MENQKIQLVARQESFKLTVTEDLEKQIRYLCKVFPNTEWSGTLFYTYEGSFENNNLHLYAKDFYLQDIGNGTYTEYKNDATLAGYMVENDLLDCEMGHCHSHHNMATIFSKGFLGSGTDMSTLLDEGKDRNHFLSLIVNNKGTYAAAITRKVNRKIIGTAAQVYNTFNNIPVIQDGKQFETENTIVEYFMLDIEIEHPIIEKSPLELRIEELKASSASYMNKPIMTTSNGYSLGNENDKIYVEHKEDKKFPEQLTLDFDRYDYSVEEVEALMNTEHIDSKIINNHITQIITGNIFAGMNPNMDINKWANNMATVYAKRFPENVTKDNAFEYFADSILETLLIDIEDDIRCDTLGIDMLDSIWALDMTKALCELNVSNKYIAYYIKSLEKWII